jgi:hypothetical protein
MVARIARVAQSIVAIAETVVEVSPAHDQHRADASYIELTLSDFDLTMARLHCGSG